jgi:hypothetical protein
MRSIDDPFGRAEKAMREKGYDLDKIPREVHEAHLWADGLLLWWTFHGKLPTAEELAADMFDEWDDPVSVADAEIVLAFLTK